MGDQELMERVQALRSEGSSPKEIARALGVAPARVAPLVRTLAAEQAKSAPEPAVVGCWVSAGWSNGLAVEEGRDWPDANGCGRNGSGLVGVLVAREWRRASSAVSVCGYLVDSYCLGVKDALRPRIMGHHELGEFVELFFRAFGGQKVDAPIELARHLVWGSVEFARRLGFEPARDFGRAAGHLGPLTGPSAIQFGHHGEVLYIQGPHDDADAVMKKLEESVGMGNFHFLISHPHRAVLTGEGCLATRRSASSPAGSAR